MQDLLLDENKRLRAENEQLRYEVYHDDLTGLFNGRSFRNEIEESITFKTPFLWLMIDVDNFGSINKTHSHAGADEILKQISRSLQKAIRKQDAFAYRYGGDEFFILIKNTDEKKAIGIANRLCHKIKISPFYLDKDKIKPISELITISIGITSYKGDEEEIKAIRARVERALQVAKRSGKGRPHFLTNQNINQNKVDQKVNQEATKYHE